MGRTKIFSRESFELHLHAGAQEFTVPPDRPAQLFVGRLGFIIERSELNDSCVVVTHKPTPELDKLDMGLPWPYSQMEHISSPLDLYPGESVFIRRTTPRDRGIMVVSDGQFQRLRTDCFANGPFLRALVCDDSLSPEMHASLQVGEDHCVMVADFGSRTGTHVFIP